MSIRISSLAGLGSSISPMPGPPGQSMRCIALLSSGRSRPAATENAWQHHGNAPAILLVSRAELSDQIPLLELQPDQDVDCGHDRKQQMAGGHLRCGPECEQKAQHERMPHDLVEQGRLERLTR